MTCRVKLWNKHADYKFEPILLCTQDSVLKVGEVHVEEALLEGHLGITKELLCLQSAEKKYHIGAEKGGPNLIKVKEQYIISK